MAYTTNPHLPKVRWQAVKMLRSGKSTREVARYFGFNQSTIVRWQEKAKRRNAGPIPTESSRPHSHPKALKALIVKKIIEKRLERDRCGQIVHHALQKEGVSVSLSSVQRTLKRCHLLKERSPWKRPHDYTPRPEVVSPGDLVEGDTVHLMSPRGARLYAYTLVDVHSRWAYAEIVEKIGVQESVGFLRRAQKRSSFDFKLIQTDHGSEFSIGFTHALKGVGIKHRHSRVRQSNDQAHVERFNRTLQEECLDRVVHGLTGFRQALKEYLPYYNTERMHLGLNYLTPQEVMQRY